MARTVKLAEVEKQRCPWCSAMLYFNHQALEIYHEQPPCTKYLHACEQMKGKAQGKIYVIEIRAVESPKTNKPS